MAEDRSSGRSGSRLRGFKDSLDRYIDGHITRAADSVEQTSDAVDEYTESARQKAADALASFDRGGGKSFDISFSKESFYKIFDKMVEKPKTSVFITLVITAMLIMPLIKWDVVDKRLSDGEEPPNLLGYLNMNMDASFDVYLPEGDETSNILNEVRENWTIDLVVLYFETQNKFDPSVKVNITNVTILKAITNIERSLNWAEDDHGREDDFIYVLSVAKIVREFNGASSRAVMAIYDQLEKVAPVNISYSKSAFEEAANRTGGEDEIPDNQQQEGYRMGVDEIIHQVEPRILNHIVRDTNGDGVWDSAISLLGLVQGLDFDEITLHVRDTYGEALRTHNQNSDIKEKQMTLKVRDTGTIPVTKDVQDRSVEEGVNALIIATLLVLIALFIFHRTLKILLIALVPVSVSMALTFSIVAITKLPITPQVIAVAPILIALGVAYGLYFANRYADEEDIEDKVERIKVAVRTTGKAVFLSAITTAGGFASLMVTNILPMQTVGLTLTLGIMINYIIAVLLVPPLVLLLDYHKRTGGSGESFKKISNIPIQHTKKILAVGIIALMISMVYMMSGAIGSDVDFLAFAPEDQESLVTFKDYADIFEGGSIGMVIVRGAPAKGDQYENSMKDYDVLQSAEHLENEINQVEATWAISIIDIFKTLRLDRVVDVLDDNGVIESILQSSELGLIIDEDDKEEYRTMSYWDLIRRSPENKEPYNVRLFWIEVVYDSLTDEMREFFINTDYSKMLIFIDMPIRSVQDTRGSVDGVNTAVNQWPAGQSTSKLTGLAAIGIKVNDLIFENAITSLFLSLVFVLLVLLIVFRSVRYSVITILPLSIVVGLLPLTLVMFNTPLTIITAMLGSIVVGAGVDFSIHTTERLREEGETLDGVRTTIETSGRSFVEATAVTMAGLLAGFAIPIAPIYVFIGLIMFLLLLCALAALFYLTAIYTYLIRGKLYDELIYGRKTVTELEFE